VRRPAANVTTSSTSSKSSVRYVAQLGRGGLPAADAQVLLDVGAAGS
jgi:hypothetical protein